MTAIMVVVGAAAFVFSGYVLAYMVTWPAEPFRYFRRYFRRWRREQLKRWRPRGLDE